MNKHLIKIRDAGRRLVARRRLRSWAAERDDRLGAARGPLLTGKKFLYAAPIGKSGEPQLRKLLEKFDAEHFDFLIFVYDGHIFEGEVFKNCRFIHEPGVVYYYFKKYVTPELAAQYDVIFLGIEDVEIDDFNYRAFLDVMARNQLDMAGAALSEASITPHKIMYRRERGAGRLVDVIEVFLTAFDARSWPRFWNLVEADWNHWGWGYVQLAQSICDFKMGLVDCETVSVLRGPTFKQEALDSMNRLMTKHAGARRCKFVSYADLK
jgi:hypothetical protein